MFNIGDVLKEYLAPLLVVITIGAGSFYLGTIRSSIEQDSRIGLVEKQVDALQEVVGVLQTMRIELSRRGEWMKKTDDAIHDLEQDTSDRYTKTEAKKDQELVNRNLEVITQSLSRLEYRLKRLEEGK